MPTPDDAPDHAVVPPPSPHDAARVAAASTMEPKPLVADGPDGEDRSAETTDAGIPWLEFARRRGRLRERWPTPWDLAPSRDLHGLLHASVTAGAPIRSILDVGATDRRWAPVMRERFPNVDYHSLDIDRTLPHDYHDFDAVDRTFDAVLLTEVLEHCPADASVDLLRRCAGVLAPGGRLLVSVPNVLVPRAQLEFTHRTAFTHLDLGALVELAGLEVVAMGRVALGSRRAHRLHRTLFARWHRFMGTDWCRSITVLGRRP